MKKPIIISVVCAVLVLVVMLYGFRDGDGPAQGTAEKYALLIESDTGSFVMQLRKGMQQAAQEAGAQLAVYTAAEAEAEDGLSGVIIWLNDPSEALSRFAGIPTVVVGQTRDGAACVLSDDESAGRQLMSRALSVSDAESVALILDDADEHSAARGKGAEAAALGKPIITLRYSDRLALPDGCNAAIGASLRATRELVRLKREGSFKGSVLGVDTGDDRVADLEDGLVDAMALDSPYAMGYLALLSARRQADGGQAESTLAAVLIATRDNMYSAENIKQVFPLLQ